VGNTLTLPPFICVEAADGSELAKQNLLEIVSALAPQIRYDGSHHS
jgi:hypothetical protein